MRALVLSPDAHLRRRYITCSLNAGAVPEPVQDLHEFGSQLYRESDALGILMMDEPVSVRDVVLGLRRGDILNRLMVLIGGMGPEWILSGRRSDALLAGADDAQPADIDPKELTARLKALNERGEYIDYMRIALPGAIYDHQLGNIVPECGKPVHLTPLQGAILVDLARRPGETRNKHQLMDAIYAGDDDEPMPKIIDVLVCKLRQKIARATGGMDVVETVWGRGYRFVPEGFRPELRPVRTRRAG